MKNLKKISRKELMTIKGGYRRCSDGCNPGELCCGAVCRIAIKFTPDPNFPDEFDLVCP